MKDCGNYWVDNHNNSWSKSQYTEMQAYKAAATLIRCSNCINCVYSANCNDCLDCSYCTRCANSVDCDHCIGCFKCYKCINCRYCNRCQNFKRNPSRYQSTQFVQNHPNTAAYWTSEKDLWFVCGCFAGDVAHFQIAVIKKYGNTHFYHDFISRVLKIVESEASS